MSAVDHPTHYGGDTVYEAIKVIEAWGLGFHLGNTVKHISRAGKKDPSLELEDLEKARWYLERRIGQLRSGQPDAQKEPPPHTASQEKNESATATALGKVVVRQDSMGRWTVDLEGDELLCLGRAPGAMEQALSYSTGFGAAAFRAATLEEDREKLAKMLHSGKCTFEVPSDMPEGAKVVSSPIGKSLVRIIRQLSRKLVSDPVLPVRVEPPADSTLKMPPSGTDDEMREQNVGLTLILSELLGTSARSIRESGRARFETWFERGAPEDQGPDDPMAHREGLPSYAELVAHVGALRSAVRGEMTPPEVDQLLHATRLIRSSEQEGAA